MPSCYTVLPKCVHINQKIGWYRFKWFWWQRNLLWSQILTVDHAMATTKYIHQTQCWHGPPFTKWVLTQLVLRSREVSKPRGLCLSFRDHFGTWQASKSHWCQAAYVISKRYSILFNQTFMNALHIRITMERIMEMISNWQGFLLTPQSLDSFIINRQTHH